jgi:hypothetical protein
MDLRSDLAMLLLLMLVGLGFTLMCASTFSSGGDHDGHGGRNTLNADFGIPMKPEPRVHRSGSEFAYCGGGKKC